MDDAKKVEVLLAEYNTLRAESLHAIQNKLSVVTFGFAGLSLFVGSALTAELATATTLFILFGIVPTLAKAVSVIWLGEHRRMVRAGGGVAVIEAQINRLAGETLLGWEGWVRHEASSMTLPYWVTLSVFQVASASSVLIGGFTLIDYVHDREASTALVILAVVITVALLVLEVVLDRSLYRRWIAAVAVAQEAEVSFKGGLAGSLDD